MIYVAIGIVGATVMPHNLYLHSALVQRKLAKDDASSAARSNSTRSIRRCAYHRVLRQRGDHGAGGDRVLPPLHTPQALADGIRSWPNQIARTAIGFASHMSHWRPLLGAAAASILFAVALLASGQAAQSRARWPGRW